MAQPTSTPTRTGSKNSTRTIQAGTEYRTASSQDTLRNRTCLEHHSTLKKQSQQIRLPDLNGEPGSDERDRSQSGPRMGIERRHEKPIPSRAQNNRQTN